MGSNYLVAKKEGEPSMITYLKRRVKKNQNAICLFQGSPGAGKTWSAISTAEQIDPTFDVDKQVVFSVNNFVKLLNDEEFMKRKIRIVIFDEPQITLSNRSWQSKTNKLMNYIVSTFRHRNIICIFACPYGDFIDRQSKRMIHWVFDCRSIDKKKKVCKVVPNYQQYNAKMDKVYDHHLNVIQPDKRIQSLTFWEVKKPTKEAIEIYEKNKTKFTSDLYKEVESEINKDNEKTDDNRKELTKLQDDALSTLAECEGNVKDASKKLGWRDKLVYFHQSQARKKGYKWQEFTK